MSGARLVARVALEWWRASGERSEARLRSLVDHYAALYAMKSDERAEAQREALSGVFQHERAAWTPALHPAEMDLAHQEALGEEARRNPCATCGGRGFMPTVPMWTTCAACNGSGKAVAK